MAEEAWKKKDIRKAHAKLKLAESGRRRTVRSTLVKADFLSDEGKPDEAVPLYREVIAASPDLMVEVLPRMTACHRTAGSTDELSAYLRELLAADMQGQNENTAAIAMSAVRDAQIENPEAMKALQLFVAAEPTLSRLVGAERFEEAGDAQRLAMINQVRDALRNIVTARPGYVCCECGYACLIMQWQCPGCHSWESIRPVVKIHLVSAS
jgi:lipopolysaccharide biosynthesis regulator YciM